MDKAESKFRNTAKKMDAAFTMLLSKKPFCEITVTDVCREAGVYRSTFYAHYKNTSDLLDEVHHATMENFYASFEEISTEHSFFDRAYLDAYLSFIEKNKLVFSVYLKNANLFGTHDIFQGFVDQYIEGAFGTDVVSANATYKALYIASGVTSIVSWWLNGDCKESKEQMVGVIMECISGDRMRGGISS